MANEQYVFLNRSKVPTRNEWQQAINSTGFDLSIDETLEPFFHSGFLPCRLLGADSGVETYYEESAKVFDDPETLRVLSEGRDFCIRFRWGSRFEEGACAMILSYALAHSFGGRVSYEGEEAYDSLTDLLRDTKAMLAEVGAPKPARSEPQPDDASNATGKLAFTPKSKLMHKGHGIVEIVEVSQNGRVKYVAPDVDARIRESEIDDPAFRALLESREVDSILNWLLPTPPNLLSRQGAESGVMMLAAPWTRSFSLKHMPNCSRSIAAANFGIRTKSSS